MTRRQAKATAAAIKAVKHARDAAELRMLAEDKAITVARIEEIRAENDRARAYLDSIANEIEFRSSR